MISGNAGEWSEIYAFFKLLSEGEVYAADENLKKIDTLKYPIIKIIRNEEKNEIKEYYTGEKIKIYIDNRPFKEKDRRELDSICQKLYTNICNINKKSGKKEFPEIEDTMLEYSCKKLKAPSTDKADITMQIHDVYTQYKPILGFSIKSEIGGNPTLLNAGQTTNFVFEIVSDRDKKELKEEINSIFSSKGSVDVKSRVKKLLEYGNLQFLRVSNNTFKENLFLVDSNMAFILSRYLIYYYSGLDKECKALNNLLIEENPFKLDNIDAYTYKIKKFLSAVALGLTPSNSWDGMDDANGGYIIVTKQGDVVVFHIYNRNFFEQYLLENTYLETASTSRHNFGVVKEENGTLVINLNLQIRFKKS